MWKSTRKIHFYCVMITAFSWVILGIWFGLGYCPLTDWQWQIKAKLGEQNLPGSFIKYMADKLTGKSISSLLIDYITAFSFAIAAFLSVYFNFINKRTAN
ncbi:DUF2784 domain-containing protein [Pedobacter sp. P351]|uniref:DUF2784 domain-containing protein n=1 Tax=Pedobacter superstes TaxID=3133441 RepID=UPI0030AF3D27